MNRRKAWADASRAAKCLNRGVGYEGPGGEGVENERRATMSRRKNTKDADGGSQRRLRPRRGGEYATTNTSGVKTVVHSVKKSTLFKRHGKKSPKRQTSISRLTSSLKRDRNRSVSSPLLPQELNGKKRLTKKHQRLMIIAVDLILILLSVVL